MVFGKRTYLCQFLCEVILFFYPAYHNKYQLMRKEYFGFNEKAWTDEEWMEVLIMQNRLPKS